MYVIRDILSPTLDLFVSNTRFKNLFLRHFPTKEVNGVTVLDRLYFYRAAAPHRGVVETDAALSFYKLIQTSAKELKEEEYKGVEDVWFKLNPFDQEYSITTNTIQAYIDSVIPEPT